MKYPDTRRMVCRDCGRTIDVFWRSGNSWATGDSAWDGRDPEVRRPVGFVPTYQLFGIIPDAVLADPGMKVARCHKKCGRIVLLDIYDVWRQCEETEGDRFEV